MSKLTDNQKNFLKFTLIVKTEFPKALRQVFKTMWDTKFGDIYGLWDDSPAMRMQFLACEGGKTSAPTHLSFDEWETPVLFHTTIFSKAFSRVSNRTGRNVTLWDLYARPRKVSAGNFRYSVMSPTRDTFETITLAIDQLRLLRNKHSRWPSMEMNKPTFDRYLQYVKDAFHALGVSTHALDFIGNSLEFSAEGLQDLTNNEISSGTSGNNLFILYEVI